MKFYEIHLKSVPKLLFACKVGVDQYKNQFDRTKNFFEISINLGGDIFVDHTDGRKEIYREGMALPILQDAACRMYAKSGVHQSHITVGVEASYSAILHDTANMDYPSIAERAKTENTILIPYLFALNEHLNDCITLIQHIVYSNAPTDGRCSCTAIADWFVLVSRLTQIVLREIERPPQGVSPYSYQYAEAARRYISEHYAERLAVDDVAASVGISSGYLQFLFHQHLHMSVIEYVNCHRVELAKQYICAKGLSLKEICAQLGVEDPSYMSRLFKKVTGVSYREFCKGHR